ncbi:ABC transporter substrate-binding protein [Demequina aurantiaca]|uniref:ABC transporter substrate-binding protein n=1 Tax=Demequina aurantiaca TaxID=676200 RepID=UPI001364B1C0|nr:extracellular solute-binding protein [Demequina aurantiaca]
MRSVKTASVVALVGALALAGCSSDDGDAGSGSGESSGSVDATIEFQTGLAVDDTEAQALKELAAQYEADHEGVTIDLVPAGEDYEANMKVRLAADDAPDIWNTHGWSVLRYGEFLLPLQDQPWADDVIPSLETTMVTADGEIFAMPTNIDISGIIYNADVLKDAGVDPAGIDSWDDFAAAADKVNSDTVSPVYIGGKPLSAAVADRVVSGTFNDNQLTEMTDGTFVSSAYQEMLDIIHSWGEAGYINPDYSSASRDDMAKALAQGQAAFEFGPSLLFDNALSFNPDVNLGFIPMPSNTGGPKYLVGGERTAFGVSKSSENTEVATDFVNFLAENVTDLAAASSSPPGLTTGTMDLGPIQPSFDEWVTEANTPVVPYFDRVYLPNGSWDAMQVTTDSVITEQASTADATEQMKTTFDNLYGQTK